VAFIARHIIRVTERAFDANMKSPGARAPGLVAFATSSGAC